MGLYKVLMDKAKDRLEGGNVGIMEKACYAMTSGGLGAAISNPADKIQVEFQTDKLRPKSKRNHYTNILQAGT